MRVYYDVDEAYPVYTVERAAKVEKEKRTGAMNGPVDVPADLVFWFLRAQKEYDKAHAALIDAIDKAKGER